MKYTVPKGSISHGTLRASDLLSACVNCLTDLLDANGVEPPRDYQSVRQLKAEALAHADQLENYPDSDTHRDSEHAYECLEECQDLLSEYVPDYHYFGMHEGDGSDLGCWPDTARIDQDLADGILVSIKDPDDLAGLNWDCEGAVFVNDHGNMTVFVPHRTWLTVVDLV